MNMQEVSREDQGLYRSEFEHDNCGIGAVVNIKGKKTHDTVANALRIVEHLEHREGKDAEKYLEEYADPNSERYQAMLDEICRIQNFTSLRYHRLDDLIKSIGIKPCDICTYCFNGEE